MKKIVNFDSAPTEIIEISTPDDNFVLEELPSASYFEHWLQSNIDIDHPDVLYFESE